MPTYKMTLTGLYAWDDSLFDSFILPSGYDKETFIETLLMQYGDCPCLYNSPTYVKKWLGFWSKGHAQVLAWILKAFNSEWDPIENYDRYEDYTDTGSSTGKSTSSTSGTDENKRSADDSASYVPDSETVSSASDTGTSTADSSFNHTAHIHGNIGVQTAASMLSELMEFSGKYNLYEIAAKLLARDFLLLVY